MNREEELLISRMLEHAAKILSKNICNDVPNDLWKGWTKREKEKLVKEDENFNSNGKYYVKGNHHILNYDWIVMKMFSRIIKSKENLSFKEKKLIAHLLNIAGNYFSYNFAGKNVKIPENVWSRINKNKRNEIIKKLTKYGGFFKYDFIDLFFYYSIILTNRDEKIKSLLYYIKNEKQATT